MTPRIKVESVREDVGRVTFPCSKPQKVSYRKKSPKPINLLKGVHPNSPKY